MKKVKICPKCTGYDIAVIAGQGNPERRIRLGRYSSDIYPDLYICRLCGYAETWLSDMDLDILGRYVTERSLY